MPQDEPAQKKVARHRAVRTEYQIVMESKSELVHAGTDAGGGGTVTGVNGSTAIVDFPNGVQDGPITIAGSRTTVVTEYAPIDEETSGSGESVTEALPTVGQEVDGGTVTEVTPTTITIVFEHGVPQGPITIPGIETTVVEKTAPADGDDTIAPLRSGDVVSSFRGVSEFDSGTITPDGLHKFFRMPCPGSSANAITIEDRFLLAPTNASNCPCAIYLVSLDSGGNVIGESTKIRAGQSLPTFELAPGGAAIGVACDGSCSLPGCFGVLQVSLGVG